MSGHVVNNMLETLKLNKMATIRTKARCFSSGIRKTVIFLLGIGALALLLV